MWPISFVALHWLCRFGDFPSTISRRKWQFGCAWHWARYIFSPTLHHSVITSGLYVKVETVLDLALPLADEIAASHNDPTKGRMSYLYSSRYGKANLMIESNPQVSEQSLAKRNLRFTWIHAGTRGGLVALA
ncbi:unnamed protein product [Linum trigynum]|uniref:Uncharacterized protein n=1 Tax=Linum trigynum TaxID=586398 RepID=A0AAV2F715_9ROSI